MGAALRSRRRSLSAIVFLSLVLGCSSREPTAPPPPGTHSIRGRVRLTGYLVNGSGTFSGTRVVDDADGVQVELLFGSQVVGRTTTTDGIYTFSNLPPGGYKARSFVMGSEGDETRVLTIVASDVFAGDTLGLASFGDLYPVPNPVDDETFVYFPLPDTQFVDINIMSMAGDTVRTLLRAERPPGLNQVRWDGTDKNDVPVTGSLYWITLVGAPLDYRAQLLFK